MAKVNKIRGKMAEHRVSVYELADALGVSRQCASGKINGRIAISLEDAQTICNLLDLSIEERCDIFLGDASTDSEHLEVI